MSKPNRRGAMALVSASLCLLLAALALPLFLQDIKCLMREERTIYQVAQQIASALRPS